MRIFVMRHAETEFNEQGLIQGNIDSKLTELGVKQSYLLAEELKSVDIDFVFSSPAQRAHMTAQPLAAPRGLPIAVVPGFREREYGSYEGKPLDGIKAARPELFATSSVKIDLDAKPPEGESLLEVSNRVLPFIDKMASHLEERTIAIVAHGIVNKLIIGHLLDGNFEKIGSYKQSNACINELLFENEKWKAVRLNYTDHLKKETAQA